MGSFNVFLDTAKCAQCGLTSDFEFQFKNYGEIGIAGGHIGDVISSGIPRDRKLRYIDLGPSECPRCHARFPWKILIIKKDVMTSIYELSESLACFKRWESMLLEKEYSTQRIREVRARVVKGFSSHDAGYIDSPIGIEEFRNAFLGLLSTPENFKPSANTNFISHSIECPNCSVRSNALIPVKYGPVNGYTFEFGSPIDWGRPGRLMDVRDRELHYADVMIPACAKCGFVARGVITFESDKITDIFVWPKNLLELIQNLPLTVKKMTFLDHFLLVREFGSDVYKLAMEQRNSALLRGSEHNLYEGYSKGIPEDVRDFKAAYRFYDQLKENYKTLKGKDYVE